MRRVFVIWLAMAGVWLAAPVAQAGGAWIEVTGVDGEPIAPQSPDPSWAPVGSTVTMRGVVGPGQQPPPTEGPWFASIDRDGARDIDLGRVAMRRVNGESWVATLTFVVPRLRHGAYTIRVCDLGCHHGVGDLVGGGLIVASTSAEARLVQRLALLRDRLSALRGDARRGDAARARLDEVLAARDAARVSLDSLRASNQRLTSQRDVALDRRDTAEAEVRSLDREARNWRYAAYVLALVTAVTWTVAAVRRRDTVRIRIPDTIEELDPADDRADR